MSADRWPLPVLLILAFEIVAAPALAASPFGVGLPEPAPTGGGWFPELFGTIAAWQSAFYRDLTASIRALKADGTAAIWLATVSFLYGVFHAAGPGHGKAVLSSYVLANGETARNGAILSMASALAQAVTAVAMVSIAALLLGATSIAMTRAAALMEIGSFALIAGLGLVLVWRKIVRPLGLAMVGYAAPVPAAAGSTPIFNGLREDGRNVSASGRRGSAGSAYACEHAPLADGLGCDCGHAPPASLAAGPLDWSKAAASVIAIGLRPCTGALIVLVFSLSQGLYWAGIAATFAMALGTGVTLAALTLTAVAARGLTLRFVGSGPSPRLAYAKAAVEALGAMAVLLFGLVLLGAALSG